MKHYKDQNNKVYAFESDAEMCQVCSSKGWPYLVPISESEKDKLTKPQEPTEAQLATQARAERDRRMREEYDPAVMQLLRKRRTITCAETTTLDAEISEWDAYANELEKVPDQEGFPSHINWPNHPVKK